MLQRRQVIVPVFAVLVAIAGTTASQAQQGAAEASEVAGTVVRFSAGSTSVDLTIGEDNPTVRDFLSLLPLTMTPEEYAGREEIGYFDRRLETEESPGSDPEDGDVIYFIPWGNIGFNYNTAGTSVVGSRSEVRFTPESRSPLGRPACPKSANERTRFRGRGWRRGRAITSAAVTL